MFYPELQARQERVLIWVVLTKMLNFAQIYIFLKIFVIIISFILKALSCCICVYQLC